MIWFLVWGLATAVLLLLWTKDNGDNDDNEG